MKSRKSRWLPLFLFLAVVCAAPKVEGQKGPAPPKPQAASVQAPGKSFTTAEAQKLTSELLVSVQGIRGLALKRKLDVSVKTRPELRAYLIERMKKEMPPELLQAEEKGLKKFGLIPKDMNLEAFVVDLYTEQVAGFYDDDVKKLFLMTEAPMSLQKVYMSHEITHALQDDHFNLKSLDLDRKDNDDCASAVGALVEGDAILVMMEYVAKAALTDKEMLGEAMRMGDTGGMPPMEVFQRAPNYIKSQLLFPYLTGVSFVTTLRGRGGWPLVNDAYRRPPLSSEQVLHPEKYLDKPDPPILISMPDLSKAMGPLWKRLTANVMGEIGIRVLMKEFRLGDKAPAVAEGWGGDQYGVYECEPAAPQGARPPKVAIVWFATWDTEADAKEFSDAYAALVRQKYPEGRMKGLQPGGWTEQDQSKPRAEAAQDRKVWFTVQDDAAIERRKADVLVIEGCPDDRLDAVTAEAWRTSKKKAVFTPPLITTAGQPQGANPLDALLKGLGSMPEGVGDLLTVLTQGPRSKGEVIGTLYRDYTHGFEIRAPGPGWSIEQDTPIAMMPVMMMNENNSASVNVAVFGLALEPVESWAPMLEMMLPMQFQQFKKLSSGRITIGQRSAYEMSYSGSKDGLEAHIRQIILVAEGKTYVITCGARAQLYQDCAQDFDKILKSFKITSPVIKKGDKPGGVPPGAK